MSNFSVYQNHIGYFFFNEDSKPFSQDCDSAGLVWRPLFMSFLSRLLVKGDFGNAGSINSDLAYLNKIIVN